MKSCYMELRTFANGTLVKIQVLIGARARARGSSSDHRITVHTGTSTQGPRIPFFPEEDAAA